MLCSSVYSLLLGEVKSWFSCYLQVSENILSQPISLVIFHHILSRTELGTQSLAPWHATLKSDTGSQLQSLVVCIDFGKLTSLSTRVRMGYRRFAVDVPHLAKWLDSQRHNPRPRPLFDIFLPLSFSLWSFSFVLLLVAHSTIRSPSPYRHFFGA